jgi:cyclase
MKQLTKNVFAEPEVRGCNFGFVTTSDGVVMIDSPQKPTDAMKLKAEIEKHGPVRYIINTEPHGDHWSGNAFFNAPVVAHEGVRTRILETDVQQWADRLAGMGPDEPPLVKGYTFNAPAITFKDGMTLHVGDHTFRLIGMPGHTPYQAAVVVEDEGVVWTSDNIFCKCQTWIQEGRPDWWYKALDDLRALPQETFVPGHGPITGKDYLNEQRSVIEEWVDYVKREALDKGLSREEAVEKLPGLRTRYNMDIGLEPVLDMVMRLNIGNLYDYLTNQGRHAPGADMSHASH